MSRFVIFALYCLVVVSCYSQNGDLMSRPESSYAGRGRGDSHQRYRRIAESNFGSEESETLSQISSTTKESMLDGWQQENISAQRQGLGHDSLGSTVNPNAKEETERGSKRRERERHRHQPERAQGTDKYDVERNKYDGAQKFIEMENNQPQREDNKNSQVEFLNRPSSPSNGDPQPVNSPSVNLPSINWLPVKLPVVNILPFAQMDLPSSSTEKPDSENPDLKNEVCFPVVGCFNMAAPWKSLLRPLPSPQSPVFIKTKILFYSRANSKRPATITLYPEIKMGEAQFDPEKRTAVIIHGFASSGDAEWMSTAKDIYLRKYDANVMIVDWGNGARLLNYLQVASNTRVVGRLLGMFLEFLIKTHGADKRTFHLIGHSLGAQICGYVGKHVKDIGRLTALDPAQPGFEGFDEEIRLHPDDAIFVDVIHTDAKPFIPTLGFGIILPHGDVDFYLNGGFDQPGCLAPKEEIVISNLLDLAKFPVEVLANIVACPHSRSYEYFIESLNETGCTFWGHKMDLFNAAMAVSHTVTQGLLKKITTIKGQCSTKECVPMGFDTHKTELRGTFVITTNNKSPYCIPQPESPIKEFPLGPVKPEFRRGGKSRH